ncbi:antA/AntB antirepressor family protein [Roseomonas gilardii]|uniref:AntA/AntB antirepressor family protein n=1 Tax=Roseomonas gilardii TaxID=257708 RepID=A0ABU3MKY1_9PROT|nr:antA/AntB antirepressor family protein [Roseomonas gilardii]MDT8332980.1 antA/AntB antirepressor family protein [Roseomonas gilardii]
MSSAEHKGLVPVMEQVIGGVRVQAADARELYEALGVRKDFTTWIKQQIARLRLKSDHDYLLTQKGEQVPSGVKWVAVYTLTLDAAKHIAMMANTDRGYEVREYFIECERRAHQHEAVTIPAQGTVDPVPMPISQDPAWAAWLALPREERTCRQQDVKLYRMMGGTAMMRWAAWNVGAPIPPHYLLGAREQFEMELQRRGNGSGNSILIAVQQGGAH